MRLLEIVSGRGGRAFVNIALSFVARGFSMLIGFWLVPLTIDYVSAREYGVWLTLMSIVSWVTYFDVGLANGLRNKLAEAIGQSDFKLGKEYVSSCYFSLLLLGLIIICFLAIGNYFVEWSSILNMDESILDGCNGFVFAIFVIFVMTFVLRTTGVVCTAFQYPVVNETIQLAINVLILVGIITLKHFVEDGTLEAVGYVYMGVPLIVWLLTYPIVFYGRLSAVKPSLKCFNIAHVKSIGFLGIKFFLIQIVCLILFSSLNLIISHVCGSVAVVEFNLAFKYFSVLMMAFTIVVTPYWNAATDAAAKGDFNWIRQHLRILVLVWCIFCVIDALMVLAAPFVYKVWVGDSVQVSIAVSVSVAVYVMISMWNNIFAYILNGLSAINVQILTSIVGAVLYGVFCFILGETYGISGIVWSVIIGLLISGIALPIQCWKIFSCDRPGWRGRLAL